MKNQVLRHILETLPYSVFWKDQNSVYLGCNRLFAENAGLSDPAAIVGLTDFDLPWDRAESEAYRADDAEVMKSGQPKLHIIETQRNAEGHDTWLDTSKVPLCSEDGVVNGILGIYANITAQKENELELRKTRDYLSEAISAISAGIVLYDNQDRLVFCNEQYRQMYSDVADKIVPGVQYSELLTEYAQKNPGLLQPNETPEQWAALRLEKHHRHEHDWVQELNGRFIQISDRPTADGGIVSLRTDITAERNAAHELEVAKNRAEIASLTKSRFLANMSHEIRTPMGGVIGMAELLSETVLDEAQQEYVQAIRDSSFALLRIVNDILDISKIEADRVEIIPEAVDLEAMVQEICRTYLAVARDRDIQILLEFDPALQGIGISADRVRLTQVVNNLLGNAVKFTPNEGWVVVQVTAIGKPLSTEVTVQFSVTDTGIGIPQMAQKQIFDPFTQADDTTTRQYGGTGLGLTIANRLVQLMGSSIQLQSVTGCGSVFFFTLRFDRATVGTGPRISGAIGQPDFDKELFGDKRVLVVEDNRINQQLLMKMIEGFGLNVEVASNGREALLHCQKTSFDLVLTDIQMPIMDGIELNARLKQELKLRIPVIAVTAHAMKGDANFFKASGLDDHVTKPIQRLELLSTLRRHLAIGRGRSTTT